MALSLLSVAEIVLPVPPNGEVLLVSVTEEVSWMETFPLLLDWPEAFGGMINFTPVLDVAVSSIVPPEEGVIGFDIVFIDQLLFEGKAIFLLVCDAPDSVMPVFVLPTL